MGSTGTDSHSIIGPWRAALTQAPSSETSSNTSADGSAWGRAVGRASQPRQVHLSRVSCPWRKPPPRGHTPVASANPQEPANRREVLGAGGESTDPLSSAAPLPCSPLAMTPGPHLSRETHPSISVSPNKRPLGRGHGRGHGTPPGSLIRSSV